MKNADQPDYLQDPCCRCSPVNLQEVFSSTLEFVELSVLLQGNSVYSALSLDVVFILMPLLD